MLKFLESIPLFWKRVIRLEIVISGSVILFWLICFLTKGSLPTTSIQKVVDRNTIGLVIGNGALIKSLTTPVELSRAWDILIPIFWIIIIALLIKLGNRIYEKFRKYPWISFPGFAVWTCVVVVIGFCMGGVIGVFEGLASAIGNSLLFSTIFFGFVIIAYIAILLINWIWITKK